MSRTLRRLDLRGVDGPLAPHLPRPDVAGDEPVAVVRQVLADVRARGDDALVELTERFDGARLHHLRVPPEEVQAALDRIPPELRASLEVAHDHIRAFHEAERPPTIHRYARGGLTIEGRRVPVDRAGLYVPGGRGAYPSTVLMTAVPARVAGVGELALCTPVERATGAVAPAALAAAAIAGVDEVYAIGGAQAIAALAYGTESVRAVDVIVGPGNVYVAVAKREVAGQGRVAVPSAFAGPSEIVVLADETTSADLAAVDLLVQAEHGPDGLSWLVTWCEEAADRIDDAVAAMVAVAPRRADIEATFAEGGHVVLVDTPERAVEVANAIAPEHLQLMNADPTAILGLVRHAGAVFCGPWSPASLGDYLAGPSHVLPTFGSARFSSALGLDDFTKRVHVITADAAAFAELGPHLARLADAEGFAAHAESARLRLSLLAAEGER